MMNHEIFMQRCFDLARLGAGQVSPNPMVGAVLVYKNRILGEGYHEAYGKAHAEVNAIKSVSEKDSNLIKKSTLYVSLEPCCIYGNTPPCTSLIISNGIPKVVISALDQTPGVAGKGIRLLRDAAVEVTTGILKEQGKRLSSARNTFVMKPRPYIILKYAQTADGFFARSDGQPFWISNAFSKRLVHKWRSETDAILITGRTARLDNPKLTTRLYYGGSPKRIIIDHQLETPPNLHIYDRSVPTIIFHSKTKTNEPVKNQVTYLSLAYDYDLKDMLKQLHDQKVSTLLVEGGARLLQSFIDQELWDEARVFQGSSFLHEGIPAPKIPVSYSERYSLDNDQLLIYLAL